jgi:hypothetical protein
MTSNKRLERLSQIRWRRPKARLSIWLSEKLTDAEGIKFLREIGALDKLKEEHRDSSRMGLRLGLLSYIIIFCLFVAQYYPDLRFEVLGISISEISSSKELLLLVYATLLIGEQFFFYRGQYLEQLMKQIIQAISPPATKEIMTAIYESANFDFLHVRNFGEMPSSVVVSLVIATALLISIVGVTAICAIIYVEISVILDVLHHPHLPSAISIPIAGFAISARVIALLLLTLTALPTPEVDYANLRALQQAEKEDPTAYQKMLLELGQAQAERRMQQFRLISRIFFVAAFSGAFFLAMGYAAVTRIEFLFAGVVGIALHEAFTARLMERRAKKLATKFVGPLPDEDSRKRQYLRRRNRFELSALVVLTVAAALIYVAYLIAIL